MPTENDKKQLKRFRDFNPQMLDQEDDFGLKRNALFIIIYNLGLMVFVLLFCQTMFYQIPFVIFFQLLLIKFGKKLMSLGMVTFFFTHALGLVVFMWFNYEVVGRIDRDLGGLYLYDHYIHQFDMMVFGMPVGIFLQEQFSILGSYQFLLYDVCMLSYLVYYLLPFLGMLFLLKNLPREKHALLEMFMSSYVFLFALLFLSYLSIPVTGPQYFVPQFFADYALPFSPIGRFFYELIARLHPTFIDCFPSGHAAVAIISCFWAYQLKFSARYVFAFFCFFIILSTMLLRYHYMLDVLASLVLVAISLFLARKFASRSTLQLAEKELVRTF